MAEDRLSLPFTGLVSFLRSPACTNLDDLEADIAILGVPSDEGSPWKPGARFAPRKIRELSVKYAGYGPVQHQRGYYDIEEDRRYLEYELVNRRIADCGDSDIIYTNVEMTFESMDDFSPAAVAKKVDALNKLLQARTELANLLTYMDGKDKAEELVGKLLNNPDLMKSLATAPNAEPPAAPAS